MSLIWSDEKVLRTLQGQQDVMNKVKKQRDIAIGITIGLILYVVILLEVITR